MTDYKTDPVSITTPAFRPSSIIGESIRSVFDPMYINLKMLIVNVVPGLRLVFGLTSKLCDAGFERSVNQNVFRFTRQTSELFIERKSDLPTSARGLNENHRCFRTATNV